MAGFGIKHWHSFHLAGICFVYSIFNQFKRYSFISLTIPVKLVFVLVLELDFISIHTHWQIQVGYGTWSPPTPLLEFEMTLLHQLSHEFSQKHQNFSKNFSPEFAPVSSWKFERTWVYKSYTGFTSLNWIGRIAKTIIKGAMSWRHFFFKNKF